MIGVLYISILIFFLRLAPPLRIAVVSEDAKLESPPIRAVRAPGRFLGPVSQDSVIPRIEERDKRGI